MYYVFFFFKQKTAYEMRISDWSSDVCSSDLKLDARGIYFVIDEAAVARDSDMLGGQFALAAPLASDFKAGITGSYYHYRLGSVEIGRASCRERVCQYV